MSQKQARTPDYKTPWRYVEVQDCYTETDPETSFDREVGFVHQMVEDAEGRTVVTNEFNYLDAKTFRMIAAAPEQHAFICDVKTVLEALASGDLELARKRATTQCSLYVANNLIAKATGGEE